MEAGTKKLRLTATSSPSKMLPEGYGSGENNDRATDGTIRMKNELKQLREELNQVIDHYDDDDDYLAVLISHIGTHAICHTGRREIA
jgi:hypothetical protein